MIYLRRRINYLLFVIFFTTFQILADETVILTFCGMEKELKPLGIIEDENNNYFYYPVDERHGFKIYTISKKDHVPFVEPDVGRVSIYKYKSRSYLTDLINDLEGDKDVWVNHSLDGTCRWKILPDKIFFMISINDVYYTFVGPLEYVKATLDINNLCGFDD
ncbi:hypothetical protein J2X32_003781 [Rheinheimera pacifica]|uniref:hypothetical protein n=1 Tax=Rheinheimera pacifica TaxID=173990 RepID=UPI002862D312|nr:hypothetical protein [Rheinheimera pacifica]MDR6985124.1 hypothetical protein [Rheinheimera pacifica]